ncbi:hypothetical protein [Aureimonas frigidaquae]|uniref:hypothetical protein n=1 Tax=Aureimonas frigidaquae TaxID=424757 RepID=UPI000781D25D|nr:hypothetical protein [Aureimonas frigidaquae]
MTRIDSPAAHSLPSQLSPIERAIRKTAATAGEGSVLRSGRAESVAPRAEHPLGHGSTAGLI